MDDSVEQKMLEHEAEIVARAKKDDDAFEILYNFYFPKIYGYVFKRVGNHAVAEDIVSETFLKVCAHLPKYEHRGHTFGAWVYRIATNNLTDYYRKQSRHKETELTPEGVGGVPEEPGYDHIQAVENRTAVEAVLKNLSKRYANILHLKFFADLSVSEISEALGISENNSRVLLHRALKKFRSEYEKALL